MKLVKVLLMFSLFLCLQPYEVLAYDDCTNGSVKLTADVGPDGLIDDGSDNIAGELTDDGKPLAKVEIKIYVLKEKQVRGSKTDVKIKGVWYEYLGTVTTDSKGQYNLEANVEVSGSEFYLECDYIDCVLNP